MNTPTPPDGRNPYWYLRSVCDGVSMRECLGRAIKNGWDVASLTKLAESFRGRRRLTIERPTRAAAHQRAICIAAFCFHDPSQPDVCGSSVNPKKRNNENK